MASFLKFQKWLKKSIDSIDGKITFGRLSLLLMAVVAQLVRARDCGS